ncbi:hypothetical protein B4U79_18979 [Dinothrombium tinctorium]|uniref:Uncharacterized protein n=1 Tax=Dinothrombium tinctorium TaxID=1965070 RepID=A0A443RC24_9ACAR|nr:hypothetical protein B4U79_18979 [Dinothrombium tinctorium]
MFTTSDKLHCTDFPAIEVNSIKRIKAHYYVFSAELVSKVKRIRFRKRLPIIDDNYPQPINDTIEQRVAKQWSSTKAICKPFFVKNNITFVANFAFAISNQVWFGCPQPFCFQTDIDALYEDNGRVYLFRAQYFWILNYTSRASSVLRMPTANKAQLIANSRLLPAQVQPYLDAAFNSDKNRTFYFKDDCVLIYSSDENRSEMRKANDLFAGLQTPIDSSWFNRSNQQILIFKANTCYMYSASEAQRFRVAQSMNLEQANLDAVYSRDHSTAKVYLFRSEYFYEWNQMQLDGPYSTRSLFFDSIRKCSHRFTHNLVRRKHIKERRKRRKQR